MTDANTIEVGDTITAHLARDGEWITINGEVIGFVNRETAAGPRTFVRVADGGVGEEGINSFFITSRNGASCPHGTYISRPPD